MSEVSVLIKKGKHFKEVIEEEKRKGQTKKSIMRAITSLNESILYSVFFLIAFVAISAVFYFALAPSVFIWAGILVAAAVVSTLFASHMASLLKNKQWKYKN
jgi:membrane protein YdbS with pleckstrin-like domain